LLIHRRIIVTTLMHCGVRYMLICSNVAYSTKVTSAILSHSVGTFSRSCTIWNIPCNIQNF